MSINTGKVYVKDWRTSEAKKQLKKLIEDGVVTRQSDPIHVYTHMCDGIFTNYKLENFKTNLKNLLKKGEEKKMNVARDAAAFANDLAIVGRPATSPRGGPVWHRSEAKRLLEDDVRNGRNRGIDIEVFRTEYGNGEYQKFGQKEFREHIYQIERKCRERSYWMSKEDERKKRDEDLQNALESLNINVVSPRRRCRPCRQRSQDKGCRSSSRGSQRSRE